MPMLDFPIELRWTLPDEFAAAVRQLPHRLTLIPKGERGVAVALAILPEGTIEYTPVEAYCPLCLKRKPA